jgi:DNA-binding transcriptional LysR family regulator
MGALGKKRLELKMRGNHFGELSAFVAVAEQASFTNAARRHGLSTATLSQTVRALETRLGVRLLNRTTRSVAPTDAGERLLSQLRPLLDGFDVAIESPVTDGFFLFYPSRRPNPAALRALIEFLRSDFRAGAKSPKIATKAESTANAEP